jgi:hypothetical protein
MPFDRGRSPASPLDGWAAATAVPPLTPPDRDTARERISCFRRRFGEIGGIKRFASPRKLCHATRKGRARHPKPSAAAAGLDSS